VSSQVRPAGPAPGLPPCPPQDRLARFPRLCGSLSPNPRRRGNAADPAHPRCGPCPARTWAGGGATPSGLRALPSRASHSFATCSARRWRWG